MNAQSAGQAAAIQRFDAHEARRVRWRNDLGWTREIHVEPGDGDGAWRWRLSIADIEQPAAFSRFAGVERELMLLTGDGLTLHFEDGQVCDLRPPHARVRFSGDRVLQGAPAGQVVSVLNLMWRRDEVVVSTWHRPLVGTVAVFLDPGDCWLVYLLAGQARLARTDARPLDQGDAVLLRAPHGRCHQVLDGGGELLLARVRSPATSD